MSIFDRIKAGEFNHSNKFESQEDLNDYKEKLISFRSALEEETFGKNHNISRVVLDRLHDLPQEVVEGCGWSLVDYANVYEKLAVLVKLSYADVLINNVT